MTESIIFQTWDKHPFLTEEHAYLRNYLHEGMHLNVTDGFVVLEPSLLIDISTIAACFTENGANPLTHLANEMRPREVTQAILLGNFAGSALDDIIHGQDNLSTTIWRNFKEHVLEFCTCAGFDAKRFKQDASCQHKNLQAVVKELFKTFPREKALLEPSFVCETLGLQGRVDLMTSDLQLLIEQKSGRNFNIEHRMTDPKTNSRHQENHYIQLLLYYAVLQQNFQQSHLHTDIRLLYSKYPLEEGLLSVDYSKEILDKAIRFRNEIVGILFQIARNGFATIATKLPIPISSLTPLEQAYWYRMMTFITQERLTPKQSEEDCEQYTGLRLMTVTPNHEGRYDSITLEIPDNGDYAMPDFRTGDSVWLCAYSEGEEPNKEQAILYKGVLTDLQACQLTVHLNDGQQTADIITSIPTRKDSDHTVFALEHANRSSAAACSQSLYTWLNASQEKRELILSQRTPLRDTSVTLSRTYHPDYDDIILRAKQASDYFLIIGPPGTGKTSMALQFLVREFLSTTESSESALLSAYTNRAVDEICAMLCEHNIPFLRIGNEYACDTRFRPYLISHLIDNNQSLEKIRQRIAECRIIVGTTSTMLSRSSLFSLKHFSLAIIDEASQILEPSIIGLLTQVDKFILIGDHKQLPAVVQQDEKTSAVDEPMLQDIFLDNCRHSLFERLLRWERKQNRKDFIGTLHTQGRMHPDIAAFTNQLFYTEEQLKAVPLPHQQEETTTPRMVFIPSAPNLLPNQSDKVNAEEARIVAQQLLKIYQEYNNQFNPDKTVGVIVPYRSQIAMIRKEINQLIGTDNKKSTHPLQQISIDTVERYQGSQRDIIIYSFTIHNSTQLEFLTANCFEENGTIIDRKLNVALTRARKRLILTGNPDILRENSIFRKLIDFCSKNLVV